MVELSGVRLGAIAGGGRFKVFSVAERGGRSLPASSVEAAGVGGRLGRGMVTFATVMEVETLSRVSEWRKS